MRYIMTLAVIGTLFLMGCTPETLIGDPDPVIGGTLCTDHLGMVHLVNNADSSISKLIFLSDSSAVMYGGLVEWDLVGDLIYFDNDMTFQRLPEDDCTFYGMDPNEDLQFTFPN